MTIETEATPATETTPVDSTPATDTTTDTGVDESQTDATETTSEPETTADAVKRALAGDDAEDDDTNVDEATSEDGDGKSSEDGQQDDTKPDDDGKKDETAEEDSLKTPDGLSDGAKKRFETLVGRVKEATQERDAVRAQNEQIVGIMEGTGCKPDEFARVMVMLGHANSSDSGRRKEALRMVDEFRSNLARQLGVNVPGVDALDGFSDLREKVDNGDLDEDTAAELAAARRQKAAREHQQQEQQATAQTQAEKQHAVESAQAELNELGTKLKASDPDFEAKLAILSQRGFFDEVAKNTEPAQWRKLFEVAYNSLGDVASTRKPVVDTPMRTMPNAGGGSPKPKSTAEAVKLALAEG